MNYVKIKLTPAEADLWDWAADPCQEFYDASNDYIRDDGLSFNMDVVKMSNGMIGEIIPDINVINDMVYRLENQLEGMSYYEISNGLNDQKMLALRTLKFIPKVVRKLKLAIR